MSGISELSDELLIKILSYLPTRDAATTMILSKRWQFLWTWVSNLEFGSRFDLESFEGLSSFLFRYLPLYRAPVIERFSLYLSGLDANIEEDVKLGLQFAVSRDVRNLEIFYSSDDGKDDILPSSLYTCKSLVTLKLKGDIFMDVPRMCCCLPSLKTLQLEYVSFDNDDSLPWFLSNCPLLEDLSVWRFEDFGNLIVRIPSLQRLSLQISDDLDEFVIDTPSLEYLELECHPNQDMVIKNMPKLKEAFVEASFAVFAKLIGLIPSLKRLTICLSCENISEVVFDDGFVFNKLKYLKLCICENYSPNVHVELLKVSPNLRVLEIFTMDIHRGDMEYWNQPSSVPECILSSLETFKWSRGYKGSKEEKEFVIYILQNAHRLKTATILLSQDLDETLLDIKTELERSYRASTTCQLQFGYFIDDS